MKKITYILPFVIVLNFVLSGCSKETNETVDQAVVQEKDSETSVSEGQNMNQENISNQDSVTLENENSGVETGSNMTSGDQEIKEEENTNTDEVLYKDGTYKQSGAYTSPAGPETVQVSLTLADNKISDLVVLAEATHEVSRKYQNLFAEGISKLVIGKAISEVESYSQVSGSSLTPKGFDEALKAIKEEAKK